MIVVVVVWWLPKETKGGWDWVFGCGGCQERAEIERKRKVVLCQLMNGTNCLLDAPNVMDFWKGIYCAFLLQTLEDLIWNEVGILINGSQTSKRKAKKKKKKEMMVIWCWISAERKREGEGLEPWVMGGGGGSCGYLEVIKKKNSMVPCMYSCIHIFQLVFLLVGNYFQLIPERIPSRFEIVNCINGGF